MRDHFQPCVYILANKRNGTLYTGMTSNLVKRVWEHREGLCAFTRRYGIYNLVWFELHDTLDAAFHRERRIKRWNRGWKIELIEAENLRWLDLYDTLGPA